MTLTSMYLWENFVYVFWSVAVPVEEHPLC